MIKNENYSPGGGKLYKSDGSVIYFADIMKALSDLIDSSMGGNGGLYVTTATPRTPPAGKVIRVIEAATECEVTAVGNVGNITARTLDVNRRFYGEFTAVTIISGEAVLYYGVA